MLYCEYGYSIDRPACLGLTGRRGADPRLTDYELLLQNISDLKAGRAIQVRPAPASAAASGASAQSGL